MVCHLLRPSENSLKLWQYVHPHFEELLRRHGFVGLILLLMLLRLLSSGQGFRRLFTIFLLPVEEVDTALEEDSPEVLADIRYRILLPREGLCEDGCAGCGVTYGS